ncbi:hypothetical protein [Caulobacter sp. CCH5-E12]|uniref:hypothetical protein n=1 Tax=Caulobacter sp. CCH5-E12 TaxID=1768770 RepID=UPI0012E350B7|nr:hypothetical protein [Caulobacter sp. CCH5-E12]
MIFSHHEPISPRLQAILSDFDEEELMFGLFEAEDLTVNALTRQQHGVYRFQSDEL